MKRTFSLTLILFFFVWAFTAIDHIGTGKTKKAPPLYRDPEDFVDFGSASRRKIEEDFSKIEKASEEDKGGNRQKSHNLTERGILEKDLITKLTPAEMQVLADNPLIKAQVEEIDRQISELEAMKRGFESRALKHEDQATRLQFEDRALLETRRHNELADENRAKAERVQQEIDRLQVERYKLLQSG